MEIKIWQGDWDLPTVDLHCLQAVAYIKFSGAPVKLQPVRTPFFVSGKKLPVIENGQINTTYSSFSQITEMLREQGFNADYTLNPHQHGSVIAYHEYLKFKLYPAIQYIWWLDNTNYVELTRPWYAKALQFPFNYFYPGNYQRKAAEYVRALFPNEDIEWEESRQCVENIIYKNAQECIATLSTKLGSNEYIFGNSPCSLDAIVFAYLAVILKTPFRNAALQNHVKGFSNLVNYVQKILNRYFPSYKYDAHIRPHLLENEDLQVDEFPHHKRNKLVAVIVGCVAIFLYSVSTGMLSFENDDVGSRPSRFRENEQDTIFSDNDG